MRHSNDDPWKMSPEAKKKVEEITKGWGVKEYSKTGSVMSKPQSYVAKPSVGWDNKTTEPEKKQHARYLADVKGKEAPDVAQIVSIDEYVNDLKEFKIIKDIYVLSDDREEDKTLSVLIKLMPLMQLPPHVFDAENDRVTRYLQSTSVQDADEVHVSFQYTEVFK